MKNGTVDDITTNLFHAFPLMYKKLLKVDFESVNKGISHLHFPIMRVLADSGPSPISEVGNKLLIPKPQMTHLIDQLIILDIVVRIPDTRDRRIINIALTDKGKTTLMNCIKLMRDNIKSKLSNLTDEELVELSTLLSRLGDIGARLK